MLFTFSPSIAPADPTIGTSTSCGRSGDRREQLNPQEKREIFAMPPVTQLCAGVGRGIA
jgi:hypothetical protein